MRHFWSIVNPSRPFKRSSPAIANTFQPAKRRKTSHHGDAHTERPFKRRKISHRGDADTERPFKRLSPAIANTSQPAKRRKTSHRGDANTEDQHPTTSYTTQTDDREECENSCYQVFLSHSGYQKSFVEQLFLDLQRENISCFFDKDVESLPKGEDFPPRIWKAAKECRVGVVVLSHEFISSKWPMLELCEFVRAKNSTNGKLNILPLFFRLTLQSLRQKLQEKDSLKRFWQELLKAQKRTINLDEWVDALEASLRINGLEHTEQETEVDYRARIVSSIRRLVPPKLPYDESYVQGKDRLCKKEVVRLFSDTPCGQDGVKTAGLYGVAGIGKTTLARVLCNFYFNDFDGRVLHVELGKQRPIEILKRALLILTKASEERVNSITDIEEGWCVFNQRMRMYSRTVFLAVDNISDLEDSIDEAQRYFRAVRYAGNQSTILLTARSSSILRRFIREGERSCMHVPSLTEEEAIPVLLQLIPHLRVSNLSSEQHDIAKKCALKCYFSCHGHRYNWSFSAYHPLALRAFGVFLYDSCADLSQWIDIQNSSEPWRSGQEELFSIFEESFERLSEDNKKIFMLLCLFLPESHMISEEEEAFNWLASACDTRAEHIKFAINELKSKGFVEESIVESGNRLYIHDLHIEFAENKADGTGKWISLRKRLDIPASLQEYDRPRFSAMKFDNCHFQCPGFVNDELFRNVLVLHLQDMPQLKIVNLSPMRILRSITIVGCGVQDIRGLESLTSLVYFVVKGCSANVQFSGMEGLVALQHLQVDANLPETTTESSPLSWTSFPPLHSASVVGTIRLDHIEKASGRLDLSACSKLRTIKLENCKSWTEICLFSPDLAGLGTQALCSTLKSRSLPKLGPAFSNLDELCLVELHNLERLSNLIGLTGLRILKLKAMHSLKELPTLTGLTALQRLDLAGMHSLKELPTLSGLVALHQLRLEGMHSLKELPTLSGLVALHQLRWEGMHSLKELPTLTGLSALRHLRWEGMHSLKELPTLPTLTGLTALRHLLLEGIHSLKELPALTGLTALWNIRLEGMHSWKELPTLTLLNALGRLWLEGMHSWKELLTLTGLTAFNYLRLEGMHRLKQLPTLTGLAALHHLRLEGMHSLKELPTLTGLTALHHLELEGMHSLKELPTLTGLTALNYLRLEGMHRLKELPTLTGLAALHHLRLGGMHSLKELPTLTGLTALHRLELEGMHSLKELPTLTGLTALRRLELEGMHSLKELPTLTGLTALGYLRLEGIQSLKEFPTLTGLTALWYLRLEGMHSLKELSTLNGLTALEHLRLEGMHSLKELPTLTGLTALKHLRLEGMHSLKELPPLTGLTALRQLKLEGMLSLKELPTLNGLTALEHLRLEGMHSLKELPTLTGLTALWDLWLEGMHSLKELPTLTGLTALRQLQLEGMHSLKELPTLTGMECNIVDGIWYYFKEPPRLTGRECHLVDGIWCYFKELPTVTGMQRTIVDVM